jgi:hypothetical protein
MNKYNIPVGSLVEIKDNGSESDKRSHGIRLYVALHRKDANGTSVYSLGLKGETNSLKMFHGYYEENLRIIDKISLELTKDEIQDIVQWGSTS